MEDRVHIECARKEDGSLDYIFAAVYDGHGGAQASEYTRENLLENIRVSLHGRQRLSKMERRTNLSVVVKQNMQKKFLDETGSRTRSPLQRQS